MKATKFKRYSDGELVEAGSGPMGDSDDSDDSPAPARAAEPEAPKKQSFREAFASAKDGSTFEWNGKKFKKEYAKPAAKSPAAERRSVELSKEASAMKAAREESKSGMGSKITNKPDRDAPSIYDSKEKWAKYRESKARGYANGGPVGYANGGVVKRATVKSHGKAC